LPEKIEVTSDFFKMEKEPGDSKDELIFFGRSLDSMLSLHGKKITFKKYADNFFAATEEQNRMFMLEVFILYRLRKARSVVQIMGFCREPLCYIFKYYNEETVYEALHHRNTPMTKRKVYSIVFDLATAIQALHKNQIVHNHISSYHVYIEYVRFSTYAALGGFEFASLLPPKTPRTFTFGSEVKKNLFYKYAPPEILQNIKSNSVKLEHVTIMKAGDIYSFAVFLAELITRKTLWRRKKNKDKDFREEKEGQQLVSPKRKFGNFKKSSYFTSTGTTTVSTASSVE
jgi:serine/threonine protein kinase